MTSNVRSYILVIVFSIGLFTLVALGITNNWGIFNQPTRESILNVDTINTVALEDGVIDMAGMDLFFTIKPPSTTEEVRQLDIAIPDLILYLRDDDEDLQANRVCIDNIIAKVIAENGSSFDHYFVGDSVCMTPEASSFYAVLPEEEFGWDFDNTYALYSKPSTLNALSLTTPTYVSLNFWYPFDRFNLDLEVFVEYSVELSDGNVVYGNIRPFMYWDIQTSGLRLWDVKLTSEAQTLEITDTETNETYAIDYDKLSIALERPLLYRLIFPAFMVGMVLLLALMPLLGDRDTLVDISAAMLFGIFGLKGIIGPSDAMGQTILNISLIMLYVILAFAILVFFVNKIRAMNRNNTDNSAT